MRETVSILLIALLTYTTLAVSGPYDESEQYIRDYVGFDNGTYPHFGDYLRRKGGKGLQNGKKLVEFFEGRIGSTAARKLIVSSPEEFSARSHEWLRVATAIGDLLEGDAEISKRYLTTAKGLEDLDSGIGYTLHISYGIGLKKLFPGKVFELETGPGEYGYVIDREALISGAGAFRGNRAVSLRILASNEGRVFPQRRSRSVQHAKWEWEKLILDLIREHRKSGVWTRLPEPEILRIIDEHLPGFSYILNEILFLERNSMRPGFLADAPGMQAVLRGELLGPPEMAIDAIIALNEIPLSRLEPETIEYIRRFTSGLNDLDKQTGYCLRALLKKLPPPSLRQ